MLNLPSPDNRIGVVGGTIVGDAASLRCLHTTIDTHAGAPRLRLAAPRLPGSLPFNIRFLACHPTSDKRVKQATHQLLAD